MCVCVSLLIHDIAVISDAILIQNMILRPEMNERIDEEGERDANDDGRS